MKDAEGYKGLPDWSIFLTIATAQRLNLKTPQPLKT
jgi:hypothetical protein